MVSRAGLPQHQAFAAQRFDARKHSLQMVSSGTARVFVADGERRTIAADDRLHRLQPPFKTMPIVGGVKDHKSDLSPAIRLVAINASTRVVTV